MRRWIDDEGVNPSDIAVLVSKQQNLYCQKLRAALDTRCVPFRDEDATQNLAAEPVANLIVDFLLVAVGQRQPGPFQRLSTLLYSDADLIKRMSTVRDLAGTDSSQL
jgi:hypothetical protein